MIKIIISRLENGMRVKNSRKNNRKSSFLMMAMAAVIFGETLYILKLNSNGPNKVYEVNLMPVKTRPDSINYKKLDEGLVHLEGLANEFHTFLAAKNIADNNMDALAADSLHNAVYVSKQAASYSAYLAALQEKLQNVPLGIPAEGYISSNFGKRKNPIPPKPKPGLAAVKPAAAQYQEQIVEEKDSLGNITKKTVKVPVPAAAGAQPKEINNPPAEADQMQFHKGLDIAVAYGSDVHCAASGTVIFAGERGGYGNCIIISHGNGLDTLYGHLSQILVKTGDAVKVGQVIAKSGNTGRSTGPHLHYEVHKNGTPVNPKLFTNP